MAIIRAKFSTFGHDTLLHSHLSEVVSVLPSMAKTLLKETTVFNHSFLHLMLKIDTAFKHVEDVAFETLVLAKFFPCLLPSRASLPWPTGLCGWQVTYILFCVFLNQMGPAEPREKSLKLFNGAHPCWTTLFKAFRWNRGKQAFRWNRRKMRRFAS